MTDEQIIKIAENHFFCNVSVMEYSARREDIIKFARAIYQEGVNYGYDKVLGADL